MIEGGSMRPDEWAGLAIGLVMWMFFGYLLLDDEFDGGPRKDGR